MPQPLPTQTNNSNVKNEIVDEIADVDIADNKAGGKEETGKDKLERPRSESQIRASSLIPAPPTQPESEAKPNSNVTAAPAPSSGPISYANLLKKETSTTANKPPFPPQAANPPKPEPKEYPANKFASGPPMGGGPGRGGGRGGGVGGSERGGRGGGNMGGGNRERYQGKFTLNCFSSFEQ